MATKVRMKQGDLAPIFEVELLEGSTPVDLTQAVGVRFIMRNRAGIKVDAPMVIRDQTQPANKGVVRYSWVAGDTDTVGTYDAEVRVTWPNNTPQTFPGHAYLQVEIGKNIS